MPKGIKLPQAISEPRQITVKMPSAMKVRLKVLAVRHHTSLLRQFHEMLANYLTDPPAGVPHVQVPADWTKCSVKVDQALAARIVARAEQLGVNHQSLLFAVVERFLGA